MKEIAKMIVIAVASILIIAVSFFIGFKNNKEKTVKLEFMIYDAAEKKDTLEKTVIAKEKEIVKISSDKEITILEIHKDDIKISREVIKYKIISEEEQKADSYKEIVIETIKYGDTISIDIDAHDPFGPAYEAPRYHSYIKVIKGDL